MYKYDFEMQKYIIFNVQVPLDNTFPENLILDLNIDKTVSESASDSETIFSGFSKAFI